MFCSSWKLPVESTGACSRQPVYVHIFSEAFPKENFLNIAANKFLYCSSFLAYFTEGTIHAW